VLGKRGKKRLKIILFSVKTLAHVGQKNNPTPYGVGAGEKKTIFSSFALLPSFLEQLSFFALELPSFLEQLSFFALP